MELQTAESGKPTVVFEDQRAFRFARRLNAAAFMYQPSPVLSVGDSLSLVLLDANREGAFPSTDAIAFSVARALLNICSFSGTEGVLGFMALIARHMIHMRAVDRRLLTNTGGRA